MPENTPEARPPDHWPAPLVDAFWSAVNAPTYEESAAATRALVRKIAESVKEDAVLDIDGLDDTCCRHYGLALAKYIDPAAVPAP